MADRPAWGGAGAALADVVNTAVGAQHRDDPVAAPTGGPAGNARLTAWLGLLLTGLFIAETVTLISLGGMITAHILIGAFLVPIVLAKTLTTGWRIAAYYFGSAAYRTAGPPPLLLRLLGPLVILTGLAVLGTGLALVALGGSSRDSIVTLLGFQINAVVLHKAAFVAWLAVTAIHLLTRLVPAVQLVRNRRPADAFVPGGWVRAAALAATVAVGVVAAAVVLHYSSGWTGHRYDRPEDDAAPSQSLAADPAAGAAHHVRLRFARAGWRLHAPASRVAAAPQPGGVILAGGLDRSDTSTRGVFRLALPSGRLQPIGTLPQPVHDAGAAVIAGAPIVFGGGTTSSTNVVQKSGRIVGHLPTPRSDLSAVTIGDRAYVVGGYTGAAALPSVLATTDGKSFTTVARLPVPVRYAAVAAVGPVIWVVGGLRGTRAVDTIQTVDTTSGKAAVVGRLSQPVSDASATVIRGRLVVAGGRTRNGHTTRRVVEVDPHDAGTRVVGKLPQAVADSAAVTVGDTAYLIGGERSAPVASVQTITARTVIAPTTPAAKGRPSATAASAGTSPAWLPSARGPGHLAPGSHPSALPGPILIADRANNRLLIVDPHGRVRWRFPRPGDLHGRQRFMVPDDAFFSPDGKQIIATEEDYSVISVISIAHHRIVRRYGHPGVPGSSAGYVHNPDDALLLPNGKIFSADIKNCRLIVVPRGARHPSRTFGATGGCVHRPPHDFGSPNGAFPMRNGDYLVTEITNDWVDAMTPSGKIAWSTHPPGITYPSDSNQVGRNRFLTVGYTTPGRVVEFNRHGHTLWRYRPRHHAGVLDHPSLALPLPNGDILLNDDYNDRVVVVDPHADRIVWQYGHRAVPGRRPGYLHIPDGVDLLPPYSLEGTHATTMGKP